MDERLPAGLKEENSGETSSADKGIDYFPPQGESRETRVTRLRITSFAGGGIGLGVCERKNKLNTKSFQVEPQLFS